MRLDRYVHRLVDTILSRQDITVEELLYDDQLTEGDSAFDARLRFPDGSLLEVAEVLGVEYGILLSKLRYSYHYQAADGRLVFRYDNAPHFAHLPDSPHHKHVGDEHVPDLADVLRGIDTLLYPNSIPSPESP
jgi:hypothetical protein